MTAAQATSLRKQLEVDYELTFSRVGKSGPVYLEVFDRQTSQPLYQIQAATKAKALAIAAEKLPSK